MQHILSKFINFLFPPENYQGAKITDKEWVRKFVPVAPYTALAICGLLILWGLFFKSSKPFFLRPPGFASAMAIFWTVLLLSLSKPLKKRKRSPALLLLIANFLSLQIFLGLFLFLGFYSPMQKKFESRRQQIAQNIQNRRRERKKSLEKETQILEEEVREHQLATQKSIQRMQDHMGGAFERLMKSHKENTESFRRMCAQEDAESAVIKKRWEQHLEDYRKAKDKEWDEVHRQQLKHMGFYSKEILEKVYPRGLKSLREEIEAQDRHDHLSDANNVKPLDIPIIWDAAQWLKDHSSHENEEAQTGNSCNLTPS